MSSDNAMLAGDESNRNHRRTKKTFLGFRARQVRHHYVKIGPSRENMLKMVANFIVEALGRTRHLLKVG